MWTFEYLELSTDKPMPTKSCLIDCSIAAQTRIREAVNVSKEKSMQV